MKLLEPITIRGIEFKNRIVMAPMVVGVGMTNPRAKAYYLERAKGGVGTIVMAGTSADLFVNDEAWGKSRGVADFIRGLRAVTDDIHQYGAKIGIQLWYGNQFPSVIGGLDSGTGGEPVAPSARQDMRQLTVAEIKDIISRFAQAAVNARKAGLDFVEIHGAHGYLVGQFFSGATNRRDDEYGGDLTRRMRFGTECAATMRAAVGDDYLIFYRIGALEDLPGGVTVEEGVQFSVALEKAGVDVIDVSLGGTTGVLHQVSPGPDQPEGTFVYLAEAIKRVVNIPVIAVGRFRTPQVAEQVLAQGKTDMIALGRQLIADPHWAEKIITRRTDDIIPCINCNACFEPINSGVNLKCSVNPFTGREAELTIEPSPKPKKVMVVGGGPAGMEAARIAARRGHKVTLYEKQNELGGQLVLAAVPPYKYEITALNHYLVRQLEKSTARVKLGAEVTPELVAKEKPGAVIIATGSVTMIPEIPGINSDNVVTAVDVLAGQASVGEKVVIIGGELVGCETADFLSQQGRKVILVRRGPEIAVNMFSTNRQTLLARLVKSGVVFITGIKKYEAITGDGVAITDAEGKQLTLEANTVVLAAGAAPDDQLARAIKGKVKEVHLAGDCIQPRRILDAIHDGTRLGREI